MRIDDFKGSCVYKITNTVNGKVYVGSAVDFNRRCSAHETDLRKNTHDNIHLQRAYIKYGEVFTITVLEKVAGTINLLDREQWYLDNTIRWGFDYNISKSSTSPMLGRSHTDEAKRRISLAGIGRVLTEETKAKIGASHKGKSLSIDHKEKLSRAKLGKSLTQAHKDKIGRAGRSRSQETNDRIGRAHNKAVDQLSLSGVFIRSWDSLKDGSEGTGHPQTVYRIVVKANIRLREALNGDSNKMVKLVDKTHLGCILSVTEE